MIPVTYRGHLDHLRFDASSKAVYIFGPENEYTITPSSYQDLYELLAFNGSYDQIVLAEDPMAKTNTRRIPAVSAWELNFSDKFVQEKEDNDKLVAKQRLFFLKNQEYLDRIGNQFAMGRIDTLPETLQEDAKQYAQDAVDKEFPPQTPVLQKASAEVLPAVSEEEPESLPVQDSAEPTPVVEDPADSPVKKRRK